MSKTGSNSANLGPYPLALARSAAGGSMSFGNRGFVKAGPERFRRFVLILLAALSVAVLVRAVVA